MRGEQQPLCTTDNQFKMIPYIIQAGPSRVEGTASKERNMCVATHDFKVLDSKR